jgi:hypothetical protein
VIRLASHLARPVPLRRCSGQENLILPQAQLCRSARGWSWGQNVRTGEDVPVRSRRSPVRVTDAGRATTPGSVTGYWAFVLIGPYLPPEVQRRLPCYCSIYFKSARLPRKLGSGLPLFTRSPRVGIPDVLDPSPTLSPHRPPPPATTPPRWIYDAVMRWAERPGRAIRPACSLWSGPPGSLGPLRAGGRASTLPLRAPLKVEREEVF